MHTLSSDSPVSRRSFLATGALAAASLARGAETRRPRILLRSSWQVVNIGDIAHTPGVLALLEKHLPEAEVMLWASRDLSDEVAAMEHRRFPNLRIVKGSLGQDGRASNDALQAAVDWADFLLHGSGPSLVGRADVAAFVRATNKPYGVYGITYGGSDAAQIELLTRARLVFFRDSPSLEKARKDGVACPIMEFGPDGAFAADVRNDAAATAFLASHGLEAGRFLCVIPRLRNTPYWKIRQREMTAEDHRKHARNEALKEHDHAPLREAITAVVRQTPLKILICPEDQSQMQVGKEMLLDKLPADVRARVAWRETFWLTDEAISTYVRSAGLFGLEMHSPIMCVGNGIPAIVCRFAEQTTKGFMWRDIGLGDWLFDMDSERDVARVVPAVLELARDPAAAKAQAERARQTVQQRQRETMAVVRREAQPVSGPAAARRSS